MARSKKRAAPTAASERPAKKRASATASLAKMKEIADAEEAFSEDEQGEIKALVAVTATPDEDAESEVDVSGLQDHEMVDANALPLVPPGFRLWETKSKLAFKGDLTQVSKYDKAKEGYTHVLRVQNDEEFTLTPLVVTAGPYKGRRIFMLEPTAGGFRLMDLPPEIRNLIYSFMVEADDCKVRITTSKKVHEPRRPALGGGKWDAGSKRRVAPSALYSTILRTSKQVLREAAPILYGTNHFSFNGFGTLQIFLDRIGSMRKYLRFIRMDTSGFQRSKVRTSLNMLKDATDLRMLSFDHENLCLDKVPYYFHKVTLTTFTYFVRPFLKALHRARLGSNNEMSVLDVIKIEWERCIKCKESAPDFPVDVECRRTNTRPSFWANNECHVVCKDLEAHCKEVEQKCRKAFAKELNIKDHSAESIELNSEASQEL